MKASETEKQDFFSKKFLVILLCVSILTNIVLITKQKYPDILSRIQLAFIPAPEVLSTDHVRGNPNAKFTVIEYADYQCPFCSRFNETMTAAMKEADVRWVYRHFPLPGHPFAAKAAEASECASDQGKFWEYNDALFSLKTKMTDETFFQIARQLHLDPIAFGFCLNTGTHSAAVAAQHEEGVKKMVDATPTFYLNGKRFNGFVPLEEFRKLVGVKGAS